MAEPYNPLSKRSLANSVRRAFMEGDLLELPPTSFTGAGVYALYYYGSFGPYQPMIELNNDSSTSYEVPIYAGKAVPEGSRKGAIELDDYTGNRLFERLRTHSATLEAVTNLELVDFRCRYLVVDRIWIPLAEELLLSQFQPLWNQVIDGFGNKTPGKKRMTGKVPKWHVLHPGVDWADRMTGERVEVSALERLISSHFASSLSNSQTPPL